MIKASVIGWPIAHSRSPLIHGYWLKQHGIDGAYEKIAVEPEGLPAFLATLRHGQHVGTNVTLPHKETALAHIDVPDERVQRIGALNTIWREGDKLHATSTDGVGFVENVKAEIPGFGWRGKSVTILGAGGSTRALVDEMLRQGVAAITIWNRTHSRAEVLAASFGTHVSAVVSADLAKTLGRIDLLVNTTSAGVKGDLELALPWTSLAAGAVVADIVYTPLVTDFLRKAAARDHVIVPGLGMLLHQAVIGFERWFGVRPQVTPALYDLVARDIDPAYIP
jgi:shikimate dehydrogenase